MSQHGLHHLLQPIQLYLLQIDQVNFVRQCHELFDHIHVVKMLNISHKKVLIHQQLILPQK